MSTASGSVNLVRIHRSVGSLGIGAHSIGDDGQFGFLARDPLASRSYLLSSIAPDPACDAGRIIQHDAFSLETVHRAACAHDGGWAYLITDHDVYFSLYAPGASRRSALQVRSTDSFLDLQAASSDPLRTALVLTTDRASTSFALTVLESPDDSAAIGVVWSRSWSEPITAVAISHDGAFVAVAQGNGNITVLDRRRAIVWVYASAEESPVRAVAVDSFGSVVAIDAAGVIKRHAGTDGSILWRLLVPVNESTESTQRDPYRSALIATGRETKCVLCCVNREADNDVRGNYVFLNGRSGDVIWDDQFESQITGAALSPEAKHAALSTRTGDIVLLSVAARRSANAGDPELAVQLFDRAQRAYANFNFAKCVRVLHELFLTDPAVPGSGSLYDDACWHLRETTLRNTVAVTPASLAKVDDVLTILTADEKLIVRRNALARLLAEALGREASECVAEGALEEAIAKYREALTIDRSQSDVRSALRAACDKLALTLIKDADAAFHEERFNDAIEMLERVQELRPGESAITQRLDHAKGLQAYTIAMRHYIAKRYQEAAFWLRKTLALLPEHAEAARYLGFAEKFGRAQAYEDATQTPSSISAVSERFQAITLLEPDDEPAPAPKPPTRLSATAPERFALDLDEIAPKPATPEPAKGPRAPKEPAPTPTAPQAAPASSNGPAPADRRATAASDTSRRDTKPGPTRPGPLPDFPTLPRASREVSPNGPTAPPTVPPRTAPDPKTTPKGPTLPEGWN